MSLRDVFEVGGVVLATAGILMCCLREEPLIDDDLDETIHQGENFFRNFMNLSMRSSIANTEIDAAARRNEISQHIVEKKVAKSVLSPRQSLIFTSNRSLDAEEQKTVQRSSSRVYSSFASALSLSKRDISFYSETSESCNEGEAEKCENAAEIIESNDRKVSRRRSNYIARKLSSSLSSFRNESKPSTCNICLMDFEEGEIVGFSKNPDCNHCYHKECILDWLMLKDSCPICRRDFIYKNEEGIVNENENDIENPT